MLHETINVETLTITILFFEAEVNFSKNIYSVSFRAFNETDYTEFQSNFFFILSLSFIKPTSLLSFHCHQNYLWNVPWCCASGIVWLVLFLLFLVIWHLRQCYFLLFGTFILLFESIVSLLVGLFFLRTYYSFISYISWEKILNKYSIKYLRSSKGTIQTMQTRYILYIITNEIYLHINIMLSLKNGGIFVLLANSKLQLNCKMSS